MILKIIIKLGLCDHSEPFLQITHFFICDLFVVLFLLLRLMLSVYLGPKDVILISFHCLFTFKISFHYLINYIFMYYINMYLN
jgi:hypothetical protein